MRQILAVTAVVVILLVAANAGCADVKDELQGVKKEIKEKKLLLKKTKKAENQVSSELGQIEKNLQEKETKLAALSRDLKEAENALERTQREIESVRGEAERKKQQIRVRLSALYKGGEIGTARMFFSSESFPQMAENLRYMKAILAYDRRLFAEFNAKIDRLRELKGTLERDAARKEIIKTNIEAKKREIEDEKRRKASYLVKVRADKKGYLASIRELEANARRLQTMVEKLDAKSRKSYTKKSKNVIGGGALLPSVPDQGFGSQKGRLAMPAKGEAERKKQQIRVRLSALYKGGEIGTARMFFSSESFPQMAENLRYMKAILAYDRRLFAEFNAKIDRLRELKGTLERDAARKEIIKTTIEAKKREIEDEKRKKASYLVKVRADKNGYLASISELEVNARRLQTMMEKLDAQSRKSYTKKSKNVIGGGALLPPIPDKGFGSQKGRLAMPAKGEVVDGFGRHKHPEFNSYTVSNGISIAAPQGSEILAVFDGQVIYADYFKGYGNMIIVDHGGGYFSLYAHAAKIVKRVGTSVARNEVVARVGDTDSTRGTILYFEIRYQGKPVDPAAWVR